MAHAREEELPPGFCRHVSEKPNCSFADHESIAALRMLGEAEIAWRLRPMFFEFPEMCD
jgi:hypothetical protein